MKKFRCDVKVTNNRYTFAVPTITVEASSWHTAVKYATMQALRTYKTPRGRSERPVELRIDIREIAGLGKPLVEVFKDNVQAHEGCAGDPS